MNTRKRTSEPLTSPAKKIFRKENKRDELNETEDSAPSPLPVLPTKHATPAILRSRKHIESSKQPVLMAPKSGAQQEKKTVSEETKLNEPEIKSYGPKKAASVQENKTKIEEIDPSQDRKSEAEENKIIVQEKESSHQVKTPEVQEKKPSACKDESTVSPVVNINKLMPIKVVKSASDTMTTQKYIISGQVPRGQQQLPGGQQQYVVVKNNIGSTLQNNIGKIMSILQHNQGIGNVNVMLVKQPNQKVSNSGEITLNQSKPSTVNSKVSIQQPLQETIEKKVESTESDSEHGKVNTASTLSEVISSPTVTKSAPIVLDVADLKANEEMAEEGELGSPITGEDSSSSDDIQEIKQPEKNEEKKQVEQKSSPVSQLNTANPTMRLTSVIPLRAVTSLNQSGGLICKVQNSQGQNVLCAMPQKTAVDSFPQKQQTTFSIQQYPQINSPGQQQVASKVPTQQKTPDFSLNLKYNKIVSFDTNAEKPQPKGEHETKVEVAKHETITLTKTQSSTRENDLSIPVFLNQYAARPPRSYSHAQLTPGNKRSTAGNKNESRLEARLKQPNQSKAATRKKALDLPEFVFGVHQGPIPLEDLVKMQAKELAKLRDENVKLKEQNTAFQSRLRIVYQMAQSQQRQEEMLLRVLEQLPQVGLNNSAANTPVFPPVSTMINNEVHLGQGVWLAKREYDRVMNVAVTPSLLVRNLGVAVYGEEVLRTSSVLGKPCMRFSDRGSRPPLSPTRYTAIKETFDYWLTKHGYCGQRKLDELTHVTQYLGSKIQDLNRPEHLKYKYRRNKKKEEETAKTSTTDANQESNKDDNQDSNNSIQEPNQDSNHVDGDDKQAGEGTSVAEPEPVAPKQRGMGRRKKKRIMPFPPEWSDDFGEVQEKMNTDPYIKLEPPEEDSQDAHEFLESLLLHTSSSNE